MWNEMELDTQYFWMRHGLSYSESWDACQNHLLQISCLHIDHFLGLPAAAQLDIKSVQKKMRLTYQLISLELNVVQGSILPLWKEENKTFPYI